MSYHQKRTVAHLRALTAELLGRQAGRGTLLTVTDFTLSRDGRRATAYFTVWPEAAEAAAQKMTQRLYEPWRELVRERTKNRLAPRINFVIDNLAKQAAGVDKALQQLKIK